MEIPNRSPTSCSVTAALLLTQAVGAALPFPQHGFGAADHRAGFREAADHTIQANAA